MSTVRPTQSEQIRNVRLSDEEFLQRRESLFRDAPLSGPIDLDEAARFSREEMSDRNVALALKDAQQAGETLLQPRAGVANWEGERRLLRILEENLADIMPFSVDSLTRNLKYAEAAEAMRNSTPEKSNLNGYPIVAHGVEATRALVAERGKPSMLRANSTDLRLVAEVAFASGMTGFVSGPMYSTMEYSRNVNLNESIANWQYIFRLLGKYVDAGVRIADDAIGFSQAGTFSVPGLMHAGVVLDALIMAEQGCKDVLAYAMSQGTISQDIAACQAVRILTREYLDRFGYEDVNVYVASNHWNGAFPEDEAASYGLIALNTIPAAVTDAELVYVKTVEEGVGIPTAEGNADSVRMTRYVLHALRGQTNLADGKEVQFEREINLEIGRALLDATLHVGDGDPAVGAINAFEQGILDLPMVPSQLAKGDVLVIRDSAGAVRFFDYGNLPIPGKVRKMERARLESRGSALGHDLGYEDIVGDLMHLAWH